jgi:acetyl-CoA carboxylase biotin carboxyl carrier protein
MKVNLSMMTIKEIQSIIKDFESSSLMTLELEMEGFKIRLSKNKVDQVTTVKEEPKPKEITHESKELPKDDKQVIKSPLVGTFYASSSPTGKPFVEVGSRIKKGQIVCIIEAMKIMNEIKSPFDGIIEEIYVTNGKVVGFNHPMIRVGVGNEK